MRLHRATVRATGPLLAFALVASFSTLLPACKSTTVHGDEDQAITMTAPRHVTIRRGQSTDLQVAIERKNTRGAVKVSIAQLPKGVDAEPADMKVESTVATFILKAASSAPIVTNQAIAITVEDGDGHQARQYVDLTVTG